MTVGLSRRPSGIFWRCSAGRQGREIASLNTADMEGNTKNAAFTWGVVVNPKDGLAYVNDFNNGLWVIRVEPKPKPVVP